MAKTGVYRITAPDGRIYVGSAARSFGSRWRIHRFRLRNGTHHSKALQNIADKHGVSALVFEIILLCDPANCVMYEQITMDALAPDLNAAPTAGSSLGYRHTQETKAKFHLRRRASTSEEGKRARRLGLQQWTMSEEHREAISRARSRAVYCIELAVLFSSSSEASKWLRANGSPKAKGTNVGWAADGKSQSAYGLTWRRA